MVDSVKPQVKLEDVSQVKATTTNNVGLAEVNPFGEVLLLTATKLELKMINPYVCTVHLISKSLRAKNVTTIEATTCS